MIKKNPSWFIQFYIFIFIGILSFSCSETKDEISNNVKPSASINIWKAGPSFNDDSAYVFIDKQVSFGPRIPNTKKHIACGDWIVNKLKSYNLEVYEQIGEVTAFNSSKLPLRNISAVYNTNASKKVMLCAHWDTRPFADRDSLNTTKPILGANDGASGVGVLLEIARQISIKKPEIGVDIIFFDLEDQGDGGTGDVLSWCIGSQYWSKNPHVKNYNAEYGVLLDMVGGPGAIFTQEGHSVEFANDIVAKYWNQAIESGYSDYFSFEKTPGIIDDHLPINEILRIPTIDIIEYDPSTKSHFNKFWHTHGDDMNNISTETLNAVGQTVMDVVYNE